MLRLVCNQSKICLWNISATKLTCQSKLRWCTLFVICILESRCQSDQNTAFYDHLNRPGVNFAKAELPLLYKSAQLLKIREKWMWIWRVVERNSSTGTLEAHLSKLSPWLHFCKCRTYSSAPFSMLAPHFIGTVQGNLLNVAWIISRWIFFQADSLLPENIEKTL